MKLKRNEKGFTLVEIMIVVAIIGLLAAVAVPNFTNARKTSRKNTCINNLRQIDAAKEQWALDNSKNTGDAVVEDDIKGYLKGNALPSEPASGSYTIEVVGTLPSCSLAVSDSHKLSY